MKYVRGSCGARARTVDYIKVSDPAHARAEYSRRDRLAHPERVRREGKRGSLRYRLTHPEAIFEQGRKRRVGLKLDVLAHYSQGDLHCLKCGNKDILCLSIDHVNGGGLSHCKSLGIMGGNFYAWLRNSEYPSGYEVLCMNCQWIKREINNECHRIEDHPHRWARSCRQRLKIEVLSHYSDGHPHCTYCGENKLPCLSMDHINGGGRVHLRDLGIGAGDAFYRWLREQDYPGGYQVLCMNCQSIKRVENGESRKLYREEVLA